MRWEICFNLTMLRMLSFALDLHWRRRPPAADRAPKQSSTGGLQRPVTQPAAPQQAPLKQQGGPGTPLKHNSRGANSTDGAAPTPAALPAPQWRQQSPLPADAHYGLLPFLAHALYVPLYLAGPIITYQDFAWQLRQRSAPPAGSVRPMLAHDGCLTSRLFVWVTACCCLMVIAGSARRCCGMPPSLRPTGRAWSC